MPAALSVWNCQIFFLSWCFIFGCHLVLWWIPWQTCFIWGRGGGIFD